METLYHPELVEEVTVPESLGRLLRKRGWLDADEASEAMVFVAAAGTAHLCGDCGRTFGTARGLAVHSRIHREPTD